MGNDEDVHDWRNAVFGSLDNAVTSTCTQMVEDARLRSATVLHAVGISQGALVLRGMIQHPACSSITFTSLVSIAGPHAGVAAVPFCVPATDTDSQTPCRQFNELMRAGAYTDAAQKQVIPAQYLWEAGVSADQFAAKGTWLGRALNLNAPASAAAFAKARLTALQRLVLFRFQDDALMVPRDTAWFAFVGETGKVVALADQASYRSDVLGLRKLNDTGRLFLLTAPGQHASFTMDWFLQHVVEPFLT